VDAPAENLVIAQNHVQEIGKNPVAAFKEQLLGRRCWAHEDVAVARRFTGPAVESARYSSHALRRSGKHQKNRIDAAKIASVWENNLVVNL
jgi:hypothetical protein